ncbi:MAG: RecX family transcriptional regulator [Bacteroidota bacterium]
MQRREARPRVPDPTDLREGTVTSVKAQATDPNRVSVFLDGRFAFGLAADVAVAEGVRKGLRLTPEAQVALLQKEEVIRARQAALDYVSRGGKTTEEVRRSLSRRGFSDTASADAIAQMERYGYLDDVAYASAFARGRAASRGHGPQRLRADLIKKGVPREAIERALDELDTDDLADSAHRLALQRWRALSREADLRKRKKKTTDFLLRRGFSFDQVREAVEAAMENDPHEGDSDEGASWE